MFESDAERLAMIRALGGIECQAPRGPFDAIFDREYIGVGDVPVDSAEPRLTARSSDVARLTIVAGTTVQAAGVSYVIRSVQPDGLGMTGLVLDDS